MLYREVPTAGLEICPLVRRGSEKEAQGKRTVWSRGKGGEEGRAGATCHGRQDVKALEGWGPACPATDWCFDSRRPQLSTLQSRGQLQVLNRQKKASRKAAQLHHHPK